MITGLSPVSIYGIRNPATGKLIWIGHAVSLFKVSKQPPANAYVYDDWEDALEQGNPLIFEEIERVPRWAITPKRQYWITYALQAGHPLHNDAPRPPAPKRRYKRTISEKTYPGHDLPGALKRFHERDKAYSHL